MAGTQLLQGEKVLTAVSMAVPGAGWALLALLVYEWLTVVLSQFPYTRPWGEQLSAYLWHVVLRLGSGILGALPDVFVALMIFALARGTINLINPIFNRIERGEASLAWLDRDTVRPSRRIICTAIWLFALVMAYPYCPAPAVRPSRASRCRWA